MYCKQANHHMMKYFDGTVSEIENAKFREHLSLCEKCREDFEQLSYVLSDVEKQIIIEPPQDFEENIIKKLLHMETVKKNRKMKLRTYLYNIAAIFAVAIITVLIISFRITILQELPGRITTLYHFISGKLSGMFNNFQLDHSSVINKVQPILISYIENLKYYFYVFLTFIAIYFFFQEVNFLIPEKKN